MSLAQPTLDDVWKLFQESDRKWLETREQIREIAKETYEEMQKMFQETDKKFQETDKKIKQVTENIGRLGNKLDDFIEEMVRPAAVRLFRERGVTVHEVYQNVSLLRVARGLDAYGAFVEEQIEAVI